MIFPRTTRQHGTSWPNWAGISYFLPAILAITAVALGVVKVDYDQRSQYVVSQRITAAEQLSKVAASLETNIHGNVNLMHGLVAAIAANPTINQPQFSALAERIFGVPSQLRNVAAAPDLVVRYVYPIDGNQESIGLDYNTNPKQRTAVMQAVQRRALVITGPVALVQGGSALIARYPVFSLSNGRFWGIVSAVIDLERLYEDSNVNTARQPLEIVIGQRPAPSQSDVFLGDWSVFSKNPVKATIELGYDTWYLAAVPKGGWQTTPPNITTYRIYALLIAIGIVAPLIWAGLLMKQRQRNILELQQREEELATISHRLQLALEASGIGVWELDTTSGQLIWDRRMFQLFGRSPEKAAGDYTDWHKGLHPDDLEKAERLFRESIEQDKPYITQFRVVRDDGEIRHLRAHGASYRGIGGGNRIVGANWDVTNDVMLQTELRQAQARAEEQNEQLRAARLTLEHQSLHDALTGLPNRRFLDQFMSTQKGVTTSNRLAFIQVDLDRFKEVNDTLGHAAGDQVLREATARMLKVVHTDEFVARVGGDEFVVVTGGPAPSQRAQQLAQAIVKSLSRPIDLAGQQCRIGCSAGIACQTGAGEALDDLLINADIALYEAKKRGRNRMEVFSDELRHVAISTKRTSDEFLNALESDQIVPYFQPQFDSRTLEIVGVEALARWEHPTRGLLSPDRFLTIAESLHRAADLDAVILEKSLFQQVRWRAMGLPIPALSVNISAQRLTDERLFTMLSELSFPAGTLSFELLESISFDEGGDELRAAIARLKRHGINIEIDDFGTGHASIVSLLELGPRRLKIDRKLIAPLDTSSSQRRLVASIIEIGRSQGIEIVAEGVETAYHAEILRNLGCHALQGYAFARPMSADALVEFAASWPHGRETQAARIAGARA